MNLYVPACRSMDRLIDSSHSSQSEIATTLGGIMSALERAEPAAAAPPPPLPSPAVLELQQYELRMARLQQLGEIARLRQLGVPEADIAAALK